MVPNATFFSTGEGPGPMENSAVEKRLPGHVPTKLIPAAKYVFEANGLVRENP
jgi:hypothetical protein